MFDPTNGVVFDLTEGAVRPNGAERSVLVPAEALGRLTEFLDIEAARALGHAIGTSAGSQVAAAFGGAEGANAASLQDLTEQLAGRLALQGYGVLSTETWGKTLVVVLENSPLREGDVVAALVEGLFAAATGRSVRALVIDAEGPGLRVLVGGDAAIDRARRLLASGNSFSGLMRALVGQPE